MIDPDVKWVGLFAIVGKHDGSRAWMIRHRPSNPTSHEIGIDTQWVSCDSRLVDWPVRDGPCAFNSLEEAEDALALYLLTRNQGE